MIYSESSNLPYPYNLLLDVSHNTALELPRKWTPDIQAGFDYALSTLPDNEQALLQAYYALGNSLTQTAAILFLSPEDTEALRKKAIVKLRLDCRWNYICYGIAGYVKRVSDAQYRHGFRAGFAESRKQAHVPQEQHDDILDQPVDCLDISVRAYNCLVQAKCQNLRDVAVMNSHAIFTTRNLGIKCAREIAKALLAQGIQDTAWEDCLL